MDIQFNRKIITNRWMLKSRFFYSVGVLLIGYLTKTISQSNISFSYLTMIILFVSFLSINTGLIYLLRKAERLNSTSLLQFIALFQVFIELGFFTYILHSAGGIESVSSIFFFLPVVSSAFLFQARGAIITAILASLLINFSAVAEYYGWISHVSRYGVDTLEYLTLSITLTKTVTTSVFYLVIGFYAGFGANLLHREEALFEEEAQKLDQQTKILVEREKELFASNRERDNKIAELERFQKLTVGRELRMMELKEKLKKTDQPTKV